MKDADDTMDMLRSAAVDFLTNRPARARLRTGGAPRGVDKALWRAAADLGWMGVLVPEDLGGMGLGLPEVAVLCEESGRHLFAEPLVSSGVVPAVLLAHAANGPARAVAADLASSLVSGEQLFAWAWQESAGQVELGEAGCELRGGELFGVKRFVPDCDADATMLVWASADRQPALVAVACDARGVRCEVAPAGLGSHAEVSFDGASVNADAVLLTGTAARDACLHALAAARVCAAAELAGSAAGCLARTLEHLRTRQQFDRPLGSFQCVQHRCVDLHIEVALADSSWRNALKLLVATPAGKVPDAATESAVSAAKARAGEAAVRVGRESVQLHGAMGFCEEVDIGLYLRAALRGNAWLGGPTALRRRFAVQTVLASQESSHV